MPRSERMPSVLLFQGARRFSNTFLKQKIVSDRTRGNNDRGPVHPWLAGFVSALNKEPWMSESSSSDFRNTIFSCTAPLVIPHNNWPQFLSFIRLCINQWLTTAIEEYERLLGQELHVNCLHSPKDLPASVFKMIRKGKPFRMLRYDGHYEAVTHRLVSPCTQGFVHFGEGGQLLPLFHPQAPFSNFTTPPWTTQISSG